MKRKIIKLVIHISTFIIAIGCFIFSYWSVNQSLALLNMSLSWWLKQGVVTVIGFLITSVIGRLFVSEKTLFMAMKKMLKNMSQGNFDVNTNDTGKFFRFIDDDWDDFLKQLEKTSGQLKEMEELKQGFISDVSHEIRSPLTSIIGFTQLAIKENENKEKRQHYLKNIQAESMRLSVLSDSLLKLATLEENRKIKKKVFSLSSQLERQLSVFKVQLDEKDIRTRLLTVPCYYYGNEELMYQVWQNLISNAIRFSEPKDEIVISLTIDEKEFVVLIKDTGVGMTEEQKNRIFERFYKADVSRTATTGGSGLGLSIVSKILECHEDLKIEVASIINEGTTFKITGPLAEISSD
ncbi:MAG: HAMP domain-containing sensor histidine kinase [Vagococcus sp.]|uniref:sensor histidine kinase n=1 Tax=Vagococcus sp. TaxID=1933889 RepID=UPI002FC622EC